MQTEYRIGYKPSHIQHHTWRNVENSAQYLLPYLLNLSQAKLALEVLDVGAGPGSLSVSIAQHIPQGRVIATDLSEEVLKQASEYAKDAGCKNIEFQLANVYQLPFETDSFDVVHASQVLGHLSDPIQALKEMLRVCRPGGIVAATDVDRDSWVWHPKVPLGLGSDADHGIKLTGSNMISFAMKAGIPRDIITFTTGSWCYSTAEERSIFGGALRERAKNGEARRSAIANGTRTEEEMDERVKAWDEWIAAEDGCIACVIGQMVISKKV